MSARDHQKLQRGVLRASNALLPTPNRIGTDVQVSSEDRLRGIEGQANAADRRPSPITSVISALEL